MTRLLAVLAVLAFVPPAAAQDGIGARVEALEAFRDGLLDLAQVQLPPEEPIRTSPPGFDFGPFAAEAFAQDPSIDSQQTFEVTPAPLPEPLPQASAETLAAYDASLRRQYEHHGAQLDHRLAVFRWQHRSSQIIFFVVIGVVAIGLYFSWMQFHATRPGAAPVITQLELSQSGLKVSSPVLGVIILVLSLAFFYLYLTHVYPISELG